MPFYYGNLDSRAIVGEFFAQLETSMDDTWSRRVSFFNDNMGDMQETETYRFLGQVPSVREWIGGRLLEKLNKFEIVAKNRPYEVSLNFRVEDLRRDKTPQTRARISDLVTRWNDHWNKLVVALINDNTASGSYTGSSYFNTTHTLGSSTIDNALVAGTLAALDVADTGNVTATEMAKAILGVISKMLAFTDDQGEPVNGPARQFMALVPVALYNAAIGAVRQDRLDDGESNIIMANDRFTVEVVPEPRLDASSTVRFYIFRVDVATGAFILQSETGPTAKVIGAGSEQEFKHREHLFGVEGDRVAQYGEILYAARAELS